MWQRKVLVFVLLGLVGCKERMRVVGLEGAGDGDGGITADTGPSPDFGFYVPDVPPPSDTTVPDVVIPDVAPAVCGDGLLEGSEGCDDGNLTSGDGCSKSCTVEVDHVCPVPGQACVRNVVCGDRRQTGGEAC